MHDTQTINKSRQDFTDFDEIWLFGYGSLIYKVDFPFLDKHPGYIKGWERRFWMGSHDHRGTPMAPGRVLTLTEMPNSDCFGIAYKITQDEFAHLDYREKNGYLRELVNIYLSDGRIKQGIVYIGSTASQAYLGEASVNALAKQIFHSSGPSGENKDYVFDLANALRKFNVKDSHVFAIEAELYNLENIAQG